MQEQWPDRDAKQIPHLKCRMLLSCILCNIEEAQENSRGRVESRLACVLQQDHELALIFPAGYMLGTECGSNQPQQVQAGHAQGGIRASKAFVTSQNADPADEDGCGSWPLWQANKHQQICRNAALRVMNYPFGITSVQAGFRLLHADADADRDRMPCEHVPQYGALPLNT